MAAPARQPTREEQERDWFLRPPQIIRLMYQPESWLLDKWVRAIAVRQDSMPSESLERMAWFLGTPFRKMLDDVIALKWNVYQVFAVLAYLVCTPDACAHLSGHDLAFINDDVRPQLDTWLRGVLPSGRPITHGSQAVVNLVPVLVHRLMDAYAIAHVIPPTVPPPANKKKK